MTENAKERKIPGLIPQKDGSFAILVECLNGCISPRLLELALEIQKRFDAVVHMTTAQKLMFLDLAPKDAEDALALLDEAGMPVRRTRDVSQPRVCVGRPWCPIALQETFRFAEALFEATGREPTPPKMKIGVSGCPACCSWANIMDLGFVGHKEGYKVLVGGHGGYRPRRGTEVGTVTSPEQAADVVKRAAQLFRERVSKKGRFQRVLDEMGPDGLQQALGLA